MSLNNNAVIQQSLLNNSIDVTDVHCMGKVSLQARWRRLYSAFLGWGEGDGPFRDTWKRWFIALCARLLPGIRWTHSGSLA